MKTKKKFVTKKNIRWKIIDTIALIVIFIISIMGIILNFDAWSNELASNHESHIFIILIFVFNVILTSLPYLIVYFALRYTINRYNKSVVTFDVNQDIEYYREKFKDITPATMSLLMDLNLESNKDLGAMKLYYELNDIYMYVKDGVTGINNPKGIKLNHSDTILIKYFFDRQNKQEVLKEWKSDVIIENIDNNLIARKNDKEKKKVGCGIFLLLNICAFIYIVFYIMNAQEYIKIFEIILEEAKTNSDVYTLMLNNPDYINCFILSLFLVVAILVYFWSIIGGIIHLIVGNVTAVKDQFKRTNDGNILAEKLYGMKNFINDFSNLDEASKKHLVLWDEFLIYAVVLEENDVILNEISSVYNTDLMKYKKFE